MSIPHGGPEGTRLPVDLADEHTIFLGMSREFLKYVKSKQLVIYQETDDTGRTEQCLAASCDFFEHSSYTNVTARIILDTCREEGRSVWFVPTNHQQMTKFRDLVAGESEKFSSTVRIGLLYPAKGGGVVQIIAGGGADKIIDINPYDNTIRHVTSSLNTDASSLPLIPSPEFSPQLGEQKQPAPDVAIEKPETESERKTHVGEKKLSKRKAIKRKRKLNYNTIYSRIVKFKREGRSFRVKDEWVYARIWNKEKRKMDEDSVGPYDDRVKGMLKRQKISL